MIPFASIVILVLTAVILLLMLQGWPNTAERIAQWWLREARRARRNERTITARINEKTIRFLEEGE